MIFGCTQGKLVHNTNISEADGMLVMDVRRCSSGTYLLEITHESQLLVSEQVIVTR